MLSEKVQCWRCKVTKELSWNYCPNCNARLLDTRQPSPPHLERDLAFLYDLYSFGWYNHHVSAVALYDATATINHFYTSNIPNIEIPPHYSLIVEPHRSQKILRAKIFAELISLFEAFGVLCIAIAKRRKQSFMWTFLNTDPQDVTQFYDRIINIPSPFLPDLLKLPTLSSVKKAAEKDVNTHISCIPDTIPLPDIDRFVSDYEHLIRDMILIAEMYCKHERVEPH